VRFSFKPKKTKSKYGVLAKKKDRALTCRCHSGHIHDSRGECGHCNNLFYRKKAREIAGYESQVKFSLDVNGKHIANHYADFLVTGLDGKIWIEEYKGVDTATWRIKKKLCEALYPDIPYKVIRHKV